MKKIPKPAFTTEFRELAVKRVADGQAISVAARELGLSDQTLRNWVKAAAAGKLIGAGSKAVTRQRTVATGSNWPVSLLRGNSTLPTFAKMLYCCYISTLSGIGQRPNVSNRPSAGSA
jgi:transposase